MKPDSQRIFYLIGAGSHLAQNVAKILPVDRTRKVSRHPLSGSAYCDISDAQQRKQLLEQMLVDSRTAPEIVVFFFNGILGVDSDADHIESVAALFMANTIATLSFLVLFLKHPSALTRKFKFVVCSSVAADFPKRNHIFYGASKAALSFGLRSLQAKYPHLRLVIAHLGPFESAMSVEFRPRFFVASAESMAQMLMVRGIGGRGTLYLPRYWWALTRILRIFPRCFLRLIGVVN